MLDMFFRAMKWTPEEGDVKVMVLRNFDKFMIDQRNTAMAEFLSKPCTACGGNRDWCQAGEFQAVCHSCGKGELLGIFRPVVRAAMLGVASYAIVEEDLVKAVAAIPAGIKV